MSIKEPAPNERRRTSRRPDDHAGPPRVAVRLSERAQARAERRPEMIDELLEQVAPGIATGSKAQALFNTILSERLDELVQRASEMDPDYVPADFAAWWQIELPPGAVEGFDPADPGSVDEVVRRLHALREVDTAHVLRAGPPPMPVVAIDDPRSANQDYLDAAPTGIDARYAWGFAGGDGAAIGFVDMEQGWNLAHEDLVVAGITLISGTNTAYFFHGTSVLGEIAMVDNTLGGVGIAPSSVGRVISQYQPGGYNTAATIVAAIAEMAFGDVLLLEAQEYDPVSGDYYWPVEVADANYEAIRLATALGIVVVEAGCNGSYDLDAYTNLAGEQIFNRASADFRDSGAVMVGAAVSALPHGRSGFSNFGSRIDCYAWGDSIDTTTTDGLGTDNTAYTTGFSGTSGASPIVVGAALILQGIAEAALGYRFAPLALRRLLTLDGTPSGNPAADRIGVMPNLRAIIDGAELNLTPDIYLRDSVGDVGDPTSGHVSMSPDIIVRQLPVADPGASFGEGSGSENDPALSQPVVANTDHTLYVRLRNRGGADATSVSVDVYWSAPSTLVTPNLWSLIGTTTLPWIPTGSSLEVSDAITWAAAAVPGTGHYCFVAVAGNGQDPKPGPAAFTTWANYLTFVQNNNNVAWRNFDVIPAPPSASREGTHRLPFVIPGAFDASRRFAIEVMGGLPRGSEAALEMPIALAKQLRVKLQFDQIVHDGELVRIPLHVFGRQRIGAGVLPAGSITQCALLVRVPEDTYQGRGRHELAIRQLQGDLEVGRLTWHFGQPTGSKDVEG